MAGERLAGGEGGARHVHRERPRRRPGVLALPAPAGRESPGGEDERGDGGGLAHPGGRPYQRFPCTRCDPARRRAVPATRRARRSARRLSLAVQTRRPVLFPPRSRRAAARHQMGSGVARSVAERALLPAQGLLEEVGDMMILTGKTIVSALRPPYPYGGEFVVAVPVRAAAVLVPARRLDGRVRLRRPGPAGGELPRAVRRARPPRRLLRARLDPRVRAVRDGDRARRRGRHGDHRRPRRAQDPRGARRAAGARRRPGQEPRRPALPRADARHRPVRHLRAAVRHLRRHRRHARQRPAARPVLGHVLHQRLGRPTSGARS